MDRLADVLAPAAIGDCPRTMSRASVDGSEAFRDEWRHVTIGLGDVDPPIRAWIAHADQADTWRLRHAIFKGGRFAHRRG